MEKLFVYALLYSEGFDVWSLYADVLDKLFLENIENETYLSLEGMTPKEAVLHTLSVMDRSEFDTECFGKILMRSLLRIYDTVPNIFSPYLSISSIFTPLSEKSRSGTQARNNLGT